ncbi:uncharacterized protein LOC141531511 isoform X2 [Cotesia typhae]|uniref:uncharacterized protein LOC141531511 isoform X2 n=1 Tax=Cotesia typhae TaxID=2053667 RepID=UPI003D6974A1
MTVCYTLEQDAKLDEEFNETLHRIKQILKIKSLDDIQLCESWLEKLKNTKNQRALRNKYILELYRLIKAGSLTGIFKEFPSKSVLMSFNYSDEVNLDSVSSVIETSSSESERNSSREIKYPRDQSNGCKASSYKMQLATSKKRIQFLAEVVNELHEQNDRLRQKLKKCNTDVSTDFNKIIEKQKFELEELKIRLEKADFDGKELEKNHRDIVEQYKDTMLEQISEFKSCLQTEQAKNIQLIDRIAILTQQVETLKLEKLNEVKFVEKKYSDELESNKCHYEMLLKEKEQEVQVQMEIVHQLREEISAATSKVQDMEEKLQIKLENENKLQDILTDQYSSIKEEIVKIRNEMQLANQHHQHYLEEKVSKLKKNLLKVEVSKHKLSSQFKRKIFEVLKTKELEITTLQMQIEEQKSGSTNSVNSEKQSEVNNIFNQVQERYKEVWASNEAVVDIQKQQFLQKIIELESQIKNIKNGLMEKEFYV